MFSSDFDILSTKALLETIFIISTRTVLWTSNGIHDGVKRNIGGSLCSHVHSVVDRCKHDNATLRLVPWKACWTPERHIDDKAWVMASLKAIWNQHYRRSMRLENGFEDRESGSMTR